AAADLDPAAARFLPDPGVPEEAVPTASGWDPAADAEAAVRPVIGTREHDAVDAASVERDIHPAAVQPVAGPGLVAVIGLDLLLVTAERDVAHRAPRNEGRRIRPLGDHPARERCGS